MRWKKKIERVSEYNTRSVRKFLLFPKLLNGEWRWLEHAWIIQEYSKVVNFGSVSGFTLDWVDDSWEDKR